MLLNELYQQIGSQKSSGIVEAGYNMVSIIQRNFVSHSTHYSSKVETWIVTLNTEKPIETIFLTWKCTHFLTYISENEIKWIKKGAWLLPTNKSSENVLHSSNFCFLFALSNIYVAFPNVGRPSRIFNWAVRTQKEVKN